MLHIFPSSIEGSNLSNNLLFTLQYGLYSAFLGTMLYSLLGTSKDVTLGPTAIMSILVSDYAVDRWKVAEEGDEETVGTKTYSINAVLLYCNLNDALLHNI